jgi:hypothetical protein
MAKPYEFNWRPTVPEKLQKGDFFDRWEDVNKTLDENIIFLAQQLFKLFVEFFFFKGNRSFRRKCFI